MHSTVSDGTDAPAELLEKVKEAGIGVFSVADHDAVKQGRIIRGLLGRGDPAFIPGAEFSCKDENGKYHILGYGFDPESGEMNALVDRAYALRMKKVTARLAFWRPHSALPFQTGRSRSFSRSIIPESRYRQSDGKARIRENKRRGDRPVY